MKKLLIAAALAAVARAALAQPQGRPERGDAPPRAVASNRPAPAAQHPIPFRGGPGFAGPGGGFGRPRFATGPVARFGPRDLAAWRGGYWWHGWRGGRLGWWWFVDGFWYWYAAPAYPYPLVVPGDYVASDYPTTAAPTWYYCYNPPGYYPYVRACAGPWRPVPATPPAPP